MVKFSLDKIDVLEKIESQTDEPKLSKKSSAVDPSLQAKKMEIAFQRAKDKQQYQKELFRFTTGRNIILVCLGMMILFYGFEMFLAWLKVELDPEAKYILIEPVKFVLTATIGYIFAENNNKNTR